MQEAEERRTGILIIRVWSEGQREADLRIRITSTDHVASSNETSTSTNKIENAIVTVRTWLEAFARASGLGPDDSQLTKEDR